MKKLEKLTKYVIAPNIAFYGGFIFDGDDIFLCDDKIEEEDYYVHIIQRIEKNTLITDIEKKYKVTNGKEVREKSHLEVEINEGQKLVYIEGLGFTISEYKLMTIPEVMEQYKIIDGNEVE